VKAIRYAANKRPKNAVFGQSTCCCCCCCFCFVIAVADVVGGVIAVVQKLSLLCSSKAVMQEHTIMSE